MPVWGIIIEVVLCIGLLYIIAKDIKAICRKDDGE
jgi:hypothetical protein